MDTVFQAIRHDDNPVPAAQPQALVGGLMLLMDDLAYGVVLVRPDGTLVHTNQAARHELGRSAVLAMFGSKLQARLPRSARALAQALAQALQGKRSLLTLQGDHGASLTLAVLPLREGNNVPSCAALVFARAAVCESLMLGFFARSHGLTPTEESVLGILCQGYSAPEIASQLKVAVSTVRSHVRSLCAKTRSSGVRELVSRVAVLPPVAPALRHQQVH